MKFYFFRPFNKDPENPWTIENRRFSAKWTGLACLVFGTAFGLFTVYQDYSFLPGAAYTSGTFVKITSSKPSLNNNHERQTDYYGQYRYVVNGRTYRITQMDEVPTSQPPRFNRTTTVAYKKANPADSMTVDGSTLQTDARSSFVDGLAIGIIGYCFIYLIIAPIHFVQIRRNPIPEPGSEADAEAAVQRLKAVEASRPDDSADKFQSPPGNLPTTPSV
jgi:hypothetical protein